MRKILITGNSGYIGSHLSKMLDGDFELYGMDLVNPQYPIVHHRKHDIRQHLPANNTEFDCVIHLAALVKVGECTYTNIPYTTFRFYNVIGSDGYEPTNPDGLFYNLMKAPERGEFTIYGNDYDISIDGTCVRDYIHVNEICSAIRTAIDNPSNKIECLGHGVGYTVNEMVNLFQKVNNVDFDIKYGPRRKGDIAASVLEDVSPYMESI
jgi:UDP-glucose 4-epimerase